MICPYCKTPIKLFAEKCPHCTADLVVSETLFVNVVGTLCAALIFAFFIWLFFL